MAGKTDAEKKLSNLYRCYIEGKISRRDFMRRAAALGVGNLSASALIQALSIKNATAADNPIVTENQLPGSSGWQISLEATDAGGQIKGYASATSLNNSGQQSITFYISVNPAQTYTIDVYRIGWYQGLGGRFLQRIGPFNGVQQPAPTSDSTTGLLVSNWAPAYVLTVPTTWTSGVYLALLTNAQGYQNYIVFVVRDDARVAPLLYQQSVTTYQAYNNYPDDGKTGKSLYDYNSYGANTVTGSLRAAKVSFDRPYTANGAGHFLAWEVNFVRWLERSGYDASYSTDIDTHASGTRLRNYKGFLSVGHDEYWSKEMRDATEAARDAGVNLAFFGADAVYWQVRFEPSASNIPNRIQVCYKDASKDPVQGATTTVLWRDPLVNRPEQTLIGVQFTSETNNHNYFSYVVINGSHWVYAGTGFKDGDSVSNTIGYEADRQFSTYPLPASVAGTYTLLSRSPYTDVNGKADFANSSIYQAASGAWIFGAGTIGWSWKLDNYGGTVVDSRLQQTTANVLNRFISSSASGIAAPGNLTAVAISANTIHLAWTDSSNNEDSFVVERSTTADPTNFVVASTVGQNVTSFDDSLPSPGVYYYRVKATNTTAYSSSNYSNQAVADSQLLSPTGVSGASPTTPPNGYQVDLNWTDNALSEQAYTVERSSNGTTNWTVVGSTIADATRYSDTSVMPLVTYYYRVKATNSYGSSGYSNVAPVTTVNDVPRAPSNLQATMAGAGSNQRINLSWTDNSSNETNFVIERSTAASFNVAFQTIKVGPNTRSYVDQNVQRRTTYYYRVKAITTGVPDNNAYSNTASATTR